MSRDRKELANPNGRVGRKVAAGRASENVIDRAGPPPDRHIQHTAVAKVADRGTYTMGHSWAG